MIYYSPTTHGFYDTALHASLPGDAVEITADAHAQLLADQATGKLIAPGNGGVPASAEPTPPAPTAASTLAAKIAAGLVLTCTGNSSLNATYALDQTTMDQIGSVARDSAAGLGLPGGGGTFAYPDASGTPRTFTGTQLVALYKAQRDLLFLLNTQAAVMAGGGTPTWPANTASIV